MGLLDVNASQDWTLKISKKLMALVWRNFLSTYGGVRGVHISFWGVDLLFVFCCWQMVDLVYHHDSTPFQGVIIGVILLMVQTSQTTTCWM